MMEVTCASDGRVDVIYHKTHVGHPDAKLEIMKIPIHIRDRQYIIEKSNQGVYPERILQDLHQKGGRSRMIERKDIRNQVKDIGDYIQMNPCDPMSVDQWTVEHANDVLDYQVETEKSAFNLIVQFQIQLDYLQLSLQKMEVQKFTIDSTHGIGTGGFKLTTLYHITDTGNGMPLLFCINAKDDSNVIEKMLLCLKKKVGDINADVLLSDDQHSFRNAWTKVFGRAKRTVVCYFHVKTAVNRNINQKINPEDRQEIRDMFVNLSREKDVNEFHIKLDNFLEHLDRNGYQSFKDYFGLNYVLLDDQEQRIEMWAMCYRKGIRLDTNNHIERFHRSIKKEYFGGAQIKRVDKFLYVIEQETRKKMHKRVCNMERGKNITCSQPGYYKRCLKSENLVVKKIDENIHVVSEVDGEEHTVEFVQTCTCKAKCLKCFICDHAYDCDCIDYRMNNVCKHLHAVGHAYVKKSQNHIFDAASVQEEIVLIDKHLFPAKKDIEYLSEEAQMHLSQLMNSLTLHSKHSIDNFEEILKLIKKAASLDRLHSKGMGGNKFFEPHLSKQEFDRSGTFQDDTPKSGDPVNKKSAPQKRWNNSVKKQKDVQKNRNLLKERQDKVGHKLSNLSWHSEDNAESTQSAKSQQKPPPPPPP
ncbi:unnamed protein product, partial [Meganyctiphanes norvegica]